MLKVEKEQYKNPQGGYYERKIDTDNSTIYDEFILGMNYVNKKMKELADINGTEETTT